MKSIVFYFRGLNTAGDEFLRFARLKLWPMHRDWERALGGSVEFVPVLNRGGGPLPEQIKRAAEFINGHSLWQQHERPIFFLAHSAGGLVARAVVYELPFHPQLKGVTLVATPHLGSALAETVLNIPQQRPRLCRLLSSCGYDIEQKTLAFNELRPGHLHDFNKRYPNKTGVVYKNIVCTLPKHEWSWPLQTVARLAMLPAGYQGDGIVEHASQVRSAEDTSVPLDHLSQIGANFYLNPLTRRKTRRAWLDLVKAVKDSFQVERVDD